MQETSARQETVKEEIFLTEKAARQIQVIKETNGIPAGHFLRVGVKGGGCSGLSYVLGFDAARRKPICCSNSTAPKLSSIRRVCSFSPAQISIMRTA